MTIEITAFLASTLGVIVGGGVQYYFTTQIERKRHYRELAAAAYRDLFQSMSDSGIARGKNSPEIAKRIANAKAQIGLFSNSKTIQAYAIFENSNMQLNTSEGQKAFVNFVASMRSDAGHKERASKEDLRVLLFGK